MKNLRLFNKWTVLLMALLFTFACKKDDEPVVGEPPVADAGTDIDAFVGSNVILNGGNSSDPEGGALEYSWELTGSPTGSSVSISNASSEQANFVPDVEGDYTANLTVEDEDGNTASDDILISATVNENQAPEAIITDANGQAITQDNNNDVVNVGNTFQLSGANSSDPEGDDLTYLWEVTSAPTNSTPTLANEETVTLDFTADVSGDYTISLSVDDGNGNVNTAEVTIEAEVSPVIINEDITEDTTWEDIYEDPSLPDYQVIGDISISAYLTIDPAVNVILDEDVQIYVGSGGVFDANGTADSMVKFTSSNIDAGQLWKGIFIQSSDQRNSLEYTTVEYAGNSEMSLASGADYKTNIGLDDGGYLNIENSVISNSGGHGVLVHDDESNLGTFSNNDINNNARGVWVNALNVSKLDGTSVYSNNSVADVGIWSSTLPDTETVTWNKLDGDTEYRVDGGLDINGNLTIASGVSFAFDENVYFSVNSGGSIMADGGESNTITFTSSNISAGLYWKGIYISSSNQNNLLNNVEVSYAGDSEWSFASGPDYKANIGLDAGGFLSLTNSTVSSGDGYGMFIHDDESDLGDFTSNEFNENVRAIALNAKHVSKIDGATMFNNNSLDDVEIFASSLAAEETVTWNSLNGSAKYTLNGSVSINGNLTVEAGSFFQAREDQYIQINGSIIAEGTDGNEITFTSTSGIKWEGMRINSSNANNKLDFVIVSNGGFSEMPFPSSPDYKCNVGLFASSVISITNSEFTGSNGYGVAVDQNDGTVFNALESGAANNSFSNNTAGSVLLD